MDLTSTIFILGYLANILGNFHMISSISRQKEVEGLSFQTQIVLAVAMVCKIFYFSLTVLMDNFLGWIELPVSIVSVILILHLFLKYKRLSLSPENSYTFTLITIPSCLVLSIFVHPGFMEEGFDFASMMIAMGSYLEATAFVPQLKIIKKDGFIKKSMGFYILMLSISRLLRVAFWIALWFTEGGYFLSIIFADLVYIVMVGDLIYFYLKYSNEPSIFLDR
jgi:hypothetical protein